MTINKFIKQNTTLLLLAAAAVVTIVVLLVVLFTGSTPQQDQNQLADEQTQNQQNASGVGEQEFAQAQDAEIFAQPTGQQNCPGDPGCPTSSCAQSGGQCFDTSTGGIGSCADVGSGWSDGNGTCGQQGQICCTETPIEAQLSCLDLGGQCISLSESENCQANLLDASGCDNDQRGGNTGVCCVPIPTPQKQPTPTSSDGENIGGDQEEQGVIPIPPEDPRNFCDEEVTCTACNQDCLNGPGNCQTCTNADDSCVFKQACSDDPQDPIYGNTCGNGDFIDGTEERQREYDQAQYGDSYNHVECPGTAVCHGGPNLEGLYWCVDVVDDPDDPADNGDNITCDVGTEYNPDNDCPTGCAKGNKCSDGSFEKESCADISFCENINTPDPDPSPDPSDSDPNELPARSEYPSVTTIGNFTSGGTIYTDSEVTIKVSGKGKHKFYIHGENPPQEDDDVIHPYNRNNISAEDFHYLGQSSLEKITFDAPSEPGTYYVVANAFIDHSSGELVCSWAEKLFRRKADGSIDLNDVLDDCDNASSKVSSIYSIEVREPQASQDPDQTTACDTSSPVNGLELRACTSQNCGGDVLLTWTEPNNNYPWKYFLYRGTSSNFEADGTNTIEKNIGEAMQQPPYHDFKAEAGKEYYYRVLAYDGGDGSNNITSNPAHVIASPACGP